MNDSMIHLLWLATTSSWFSKWFKSLSFHFPNISFFLYSKCDI